MTSVVSNKQLAKVENEYQGQVSQIEQQANGLVISDEAGKGEAANLLGQIATARKNVEETRKSMVKPINDGLKSINSWFKNFSTPLETADKTLRDKILRYNQEQARIAREEQERLRKLQEKEQKRLERQASKKGIAPPPPPPVIPAMNEPAKTTRSDAGTVTSKKTWDFEIVDENKIPRMFLQVNEKAIRAAVKSGVREIAGCRVFQREDLSVRAK